MQLDRNSHLGTLLTSHRSWLVGGINLVGCPLHSVADAKPVEMAKNINNHSKPANPKALSAPARMIGAIAQLMLSKLVAIPSPVVVKPSRFSSWGTISSWAVIVWRSSADTSSGDWWEVRSEEDGAFAACVASSRVRATPAQYAVLKNASAEPSKNNGMVASRICKQRAK